MGTEAGYRTYVVGLDGHFLWSNEFLRQMTKPLVSMLDSTLTATTLSFGVANRFVAKLKARHREQ